MKAIAVIPARMGSSRFPGKPLVPICGLPMFLHVSLRAQQCRTLDGVYIATPDEELRKSAERSGAPDSATLTTPWVNGQLAAGVDLFVSAAGSLTAIGSTGQSLGLAAAANAGQLSLEARGLSGQTSVALSATGYDNLYLEGARAVGDQAPSDSLRVELGASGSVELSGDVSALHDDAVLSAIGTGAAEVRINGGTVDYIGGNILAGNAPFLGHRNSAPADSVGGRIYRRPGRRRAHFHRRFADQFECSPGSFHRRRR